MSVYFAERDGLIKIGTSGQPPRRVRSLGAKLIKTIPGSFSEERSLHRKFHNERVVGEWFEPSPTLLEFISAQQDEEVTPSELLNSKAVAAMFATSTESVRQWAESGKLPGFRTPGGHWRFRRSDVLALLSPTTDGAA